MPRPRKCLISLSDTPYYHCVSRCVRRAYLCGEDKVSGRSYEHRRQWVEDRLMLLAEVFCVDVCAFAIMSNHTHVVLRINKQKADALSTTEIIQRWHKMFKGMLLSQRFLHPEQGKSLTEAETTTVTAVAEVYRRRLYDISWFMRLLNEYIARQANKEDDCTGHFWEGRFKSQALLDDAALAACMVYVDLNPIRAGISKTPETSNHTSIQQRINAAKFNKQPKLLFPFTGNIRANMPDGLPFQLQDYLALVEFSGRHYHPQKRGKIEDTASPILTRTGLELADWQTMISGIETEFHTSISIEKLNRILGRKNKYNSA